MAVTELVEAGNAITLSKIALLIQMHAYRTKLVLNVATEFALILLISFSVKKTKEEEQVKIKLMKKTKMRMKTMGMKMVKIKETMEGMMKKKGGREIIKERDKDQVNEAI